MALEIHPAFAVPIAQHQIPDHTELNEELKRLFLAKEAAGTLHANPRPALQLHPGVFESIFDLFSWPDPCVRSLREFCWRSLGLAIQQINGYSDEEVRRLEIYSHTWFHVTRQGGFTILHAHPMAAWSGVYCVAPGQAVDAHPESGVLRFHNPHHYSNYFTDPGNSRFKPPYHHGSWSIKLRAGQLVLFPSWLQHEVLPFYGSDERITVAFNCWFAERNSPARA